MAGPATGSGQITGRCATAGYDLPMAIRQGENFVGNRSHVYRVNRGKKNRFASGKNLRKHQKKISVAECGDGLGGASTVRNPKQALAPNIAHDNAAILTPTGAAEVGRVPQRDHGAAFHGDLVQLAACGESDPLP